MQFLSVNSALIRFFSVVTHTFLLFCYLQFASIRSNKYGFSRQKNNRNAEMFSTFSSISHVLCRNNSSIKYIKCMIKRNCQNYQLPKFQAANDQFLQVLKSRFYEGEELQNCETLILQEQLQPLDRWTGKALHCWLTKLIISSDLYI